MRSIRRQSPSLHTDKRPPTDVDAAGVRRQAAVCPGGGQGFDAGGSHKEGVLFLGCHCYDQPVINPFLQYVLSFQQRHLVLVATF